MQWVVDYCMLTLQTDDEIPASDCIARERLARFGSACAAKTHFRLEVCRRLRAPASVIELCVRDPGVMGRTVRKGGVGGR